MVPVEKISTALTKLDSSRWLIRRPADVPVVGTVMVTAPLSAKIMRPDPEPVGPSYAESNETAAEPTEGQPTPFARQTD